jgi:tetrahydromethanopterin S-methyltransferase subunit C
VQQRAAQAEVSALGANTEAAQMLLPRRTSQSHAERRRARIYSLTSGIPTILWYTVAVGALVNMILLWLFDLRPHAHWILGGLISFYLGTVISVTALMTEAFELIYHQVMGQ